MPGKGLWALVSGYINDMETWRQAASRELFEEIGLLSNPECYKLLDVLSSENKINMLIASEYIFPYQESDLTFSPNEEVSSVNIIFEPIELAFPSHTEMVKRYFDYQVK